MTFEEWKAERVQSTPEVLGGEPVFRKTRLAVSMVAARLARGEAPDVVRADYPYLTEDDVAYAPRCYSGSSAGMQP